MVEVKERLVKKALLRITFRSRREMGELLTGCLLSAMLMFGGFAERHGCRDLGLVRGPRQGSATISRSSTFFFASRQ